MQRFAKFTTYLAMICIVIAIWPVEHNCLQVTNTLGSRNKRHRPEDIKDKISSPTKTDYLKYWRPKELIKDQPQNSQHIPASGVLMFDYFNKLNPLWNTIFHSILSVRTVFGNYVGKLYGQNKSMSSSELPSNNDQEDERTNRKNNLIDRSENNLGRGKEVYVNKMRRKKRSLSLHTKKKVQLTKPKISKVEKQGIVPSKSTKQDKQRKRHVEDALRNYGENIQYGTSHAQGYRNDQAWPDDSAHSSRDNQLSPPPPAFGLFATVQELVLTVKDLHAQQVKDRRNIRQLKRRYEEQSQELSTTRDLADECKSRIRRLETSLGNLDAKMAEREVEVRDLRSRTIDNLERIQDQDSGVTDMRSGLKRVQDKVTEVADKLDVWNNRVSVVERAARRRIKRKHLEMESKLASNSEVDSKTKAKHDKQLSTQIDQDKHGHRDRISSSVSSELKDNHTKIQNKDLPKRTSLNVSFIIQDNSTEIDRHGNKLHDDQIVKATSRRRTRRNDKDDEQESEISKSEVFHDKTVLVSKLQSLDSNISASETSGTYLTNLATPTMRHDTQYISDIFSSSPSHSFFLSSFVDQQYSTDAPVLQSLSSEMIQQIKDIFEDEIPFKPTQSSLSYSSHLSKTLNCDSAVDESSDNCKTKTHHSEQSRDVHSEQSRDVQSQIPSVVLQSSQQYQPFQSSFELTQSFLSEDFQPQKSTLYQLPASSPSSFVLLHPASQDRYWEDLSTQIQPTPSLKSSIHLQDFKSNPGSSFLQDNFSENMQDTFTYLQDIGNKETAFAYPDISSLSHDFAMLTNSLSDTLGIRSYVFDNYPSSDSISPEISRLKPLATTDEFLQASYGSYSLDNIVSTSVIHGSKSTLLSFSSFRLDDSVFTVSESSVASQQQLPLVSRYINPTQSSTILYPFQPPHSSSIPQSTSNKQQNETNLALTHDQLLSIIKELVNNETYRIQAELEKQRRGLRKSRQILREELVKRDTTLKQLENVTEMTSVEVKQLDEKISLINIEDLIAHMDDTLDEITRDVVNQRPWKASFHRALNASKQNEKEIHAQHKIQTNTLKRLAKLEDNTATFQALTQRWYRNLQGHVIRLNNSVQDMEEQMNRKLESQQVKALQADGVASRTVVQTEIESLRIQLLYNANRIGSLENSLLNATLTKCRRTAQENRQAEKLIDLRERYDNAQTETYLLKEKVKQTDLNLFLARKQISDNLRAVENLNSQIRDIGPSLPALKTLSRDVENIVEQVLPDCHAYFQMGYRTSRVYTIHPGTLGTTIRVFCVMEEQETDHSLSEEEDKTLAELVRGVSYTSTQTGTSKSVRKLKSRRHAIALPILPIQSITGIGSTLEEEELEGSDDKLRENGGQDKSEIDNGKKVQRKNEVTSVETEHRDVLKESNSSANTSKRKRSKRRRRQRSKEKSKKSEEKRTKKKRRRRDTTSGATARRRRRIRRQRKHRQGREDVVPKTPRNVKNQSTLSRDSFDSVLASTKPQLDAQSPSWTKPQLDAQSASSDATRQNPITRGGWTVIQRRRDGSVNFTQTWAQYAAGFGVVEKGEDLWIGNEALHHLTKREPMELRIIMEDVFSSVWEARYTRFRVAGRGDNYRIQLNGYHGNASDALGQCDRMTFSTVDRPGEKGTRGEHCARYNGAGWWYPQCHVSNLNGPFPLGMLWFNNAWLDWVQVKSSLMMVRPQGHSQRWP